MAEEIKAMGPQEQADRENEMILALCREAGDVGTAADLIDGFLSNHHPEDIAAAASGDVAALIRLRQACGLPIFS